MDKLYKKLSVYLAENQVISKNDKELYEYATKVVVHGLINIGVTILIGFFFGMLKEAIVLHFSFMIVRKFSGGLHMKSYIACMLTSSIIFLFALIVIKYLEENKLSVSFYIIVILLSIITIVLAPLENTNKNLSNKEKVVYKVICTIIIIIFTILSIFLINKKISFEYGYSIGVSIVLNGLLLLLGYCFSN